MVDTLIVPVKALIDTPHIAATITKGVDTFMEAVPSLMKALDEVAKIHPFISGASSLLSNWGCLVIVDLAQLPSLRSRLFTLLKRNDVKTIRGSWLSTLSM